MNIRCFLIAGLALLFASGCCTPKELTSAASHDTVAVIRVQHDSVERWHTRYVTTAGDTVYVVDTIMMERWHTRWRDSVVVRQDTVVKVQIKEVPKKVGINNLLLIAVGLLVIIILFIMKVKH